MNSKLINKEFKLRVISSLSILLALILVIMLGDLYIKIGLIILSFVLFYELENLHKKKKLMYGFYHR